MKLTFIKCVSIEVLQRNALCPTPIDMFLVAVCYSKYECYRGHCLLSSDFSNATFWKCGLFPAIDGCLREHRHNLKGKELIVQFV